MVRRFFVFRRGEREETSKSSKADLVTLDSVGRSGVCGGGGSTSDAVGKVGAARMTALAGE
jgi:hypothetical protein